MVLRGATSLRGALEGVGPENRDFLGPEMARARPGECSEEGLLGGGVCVFFGQN